MQIVLVIIKERDEYFNKNNKNICSNNVLLLANNAYILQDLQRDILFTL